MLGPLADVARDDVCAGATHVIVALPGATTVQRRRAVELASATGLPVLTVPSVNELQDGRARIERERSIEPEDLLGRDTVVLDEAGDLRIALLHTAESPRLIEDLGAGLAAYAPGAPEESVKRLCSNTCRNTGRVSLCTFLAN